MIEVENNMDNDMKNVGKYYIVVFGSELDITTKDGIVRFKTNTHCSLFTFLSVYVAHLSLLY